MGTLINGIYIPDSGEMGWGTGQNKLNDTLELLAKRTEYFPNDGTHGDAAHGPDYAKVSELFTAAQARAAVEGNSDAAALTGESGTSGQVLQSDGVNASWGDVSGGGQAAYTKVASGSVTLSNGTGTVDTGVATDGQYYTVNIDPVGADVAASLDGTGTNYVIHIEENSSNVGNPTVGYEFVRSEL